MTEHKYKIVADRDRLYFACIKCNFSQEYNERHGRKACPAADTQTASSRREALG
jgi:hypothetical protein